MQRVYVNPIYKDKITVLTSASETGGKYAEYELEVTPNGSNTPHYHRAFTETFTVLEGTLGVKLGSKSVLLQPGESYTVPVGVGHHFFNPSTKTVRCRVTFTPGHDGFETAIRILYGLARDGKTDKKGTPKDLATLGLIMQLSDSYIPGPMSILNPAFRWFAGRARRNGLERQLMQTYCPDMLEAQEHSFV